MELPIEGHTNIFWNDDKWIKNRASVTYLLPNLNLDYILSFLAKTNVYTHIVLRLFCYIRSAIPIAALPKPTVR